MIIQKNLRKYFGRSKQIDTDIFIPLYEHLGNVCLSKETTI